MNRLRSFLIAGTLAGGLCLAEMPAEADVPNYFAEASHIPPDSCSEEIRHKLGNRALESLVIDMSLAKKRDPSTNKENTEAAKALPPLPEDTPSLAQYIRERVRPQETIELPLSGIVMNISSNVSLYSVDAARIDNMLATTLETRVEGARLRNEVYSCLGRLIFEDRALAGHLLNVVYLDQIVIRGNFAVDRNSGEGNVGGRYRYGSDTIIVAGSDDPWSNNIKFAHELGHGLNDLFDTRPSTDKLSENFAYGFGGAAQEYFTANPHNIFEPRAQSRGSSLLALMN